MAKTASSIGPVVSAAHLADGAIPALSEVEFALTVLSNAFQRWMVRCMSASGVPGLAGSGSSSDESTPSTCTRRNAPSRRISSRIAFASTRTTAGSLADHRSEVPSPVSTSPTNSVLPTNNFTCCASAPFRRTTGVRTRTVMSSFSGMAGVGGTADEGDASVPAPALPAAGRVPAKLGTSTRLEAQNDAESGPRQQAAEEPSREPGRDGQQG